MNESSKPYMIKRLLKQFNSDKFYRRDNGEIGINRGGKVHWFRWHGGKKAYMKQEITKDQGSAIEYTRESLMTSVQGNADSDSRLLSETLLKQ